MEITSEECEWCKGSGVDSEGAALGNPYACIDCQGTGFKYGKLGRRKYIDEQDELFKIVCPE